MPSTDTVLASVLKRDRAVVAVALFAIAALAWAWLLWLAYGMQTDAGMAMDAMSNAMAPAFIPCTQAHVAFVWGMWSVMMVGMMVPSAAPMILIYAQVARQANTLKAPFASSAWFALGYLLAWAMFTSVTTLGQYGLDRAALLSPMMAANSSVIGAALLIAAGVYQFTPVKAACLSKCQAPLAFVQRNGGFKPGRAGSIRLGFRHGAYCVGCCWALMSLLFVAGVMNIIWIACLTAIVLLEKTLASPRLVPWLAGSILIASGLFMLAR